jgi:maltose O-acetyltransferase
VTIGDDVTFSGGGGVRIIAHDASTRTHLNYTRIGKVNIGNRVYIGGGSSILPGVTIGDDVIIGAGSIVTRDIPRGSVACGNPAKIIKTIDEFIAVKKKEMQTYPRFEKEYINETKKMKDRIGYIAE